MKWRNLRPQILAALRDTPVVYLQGPRQAGKSTLAQALRDAPASATILEYRRPDSVITKFVRSKGYFGAYNPDGTIRTFFIPNAGERYFHRQARR